MASSIFHFATMEVALNTGPDIQDITDDLNRIVGRSGIETGQASACIEEGLKIVETARGLAMDPMAMLFDEPTSLVLRDR